MQIGIYNRGSVFPSCLHHRMKLWFIYHKNLFSFRSSLIHIQFEPGYRIKISSLFNIVALPITQKSANINCVLLLRGKERKRTKREHESPTCAKFLQMNQVTEVCRNVVCSNNKIWCVRYHRFTSNFLLLWCIYFNYIPLFILPTTVSSLK